MASITSPEQGAQQLCSSTFFSPPGGVRTGRSNVFSARSLMARGFSKKPPGDHPTAVIPGFVPRIGPSPGMTAGGMSARELRGRVGDLTPLGHQHLVRL